MEAGYNGYRAGQANDGAHVAHEVHEVHEVLGRVQEGVGGPEVEGGGMVDHAEVRVEGSTVHVLEACVAHVGVLWAEVEVHEVWAGGKEERVELVGSLDDASYDSLVVLVGVERRVQLRASDAAHDVPVGGEAAPHDPPRATYAHGVQDGGVEAAF